MRKKILATFLVLCMVLGMLPTVALAAEDETPTSGVPETVESEETLLEDVDDAEGEDDATSENTGEDADGDGSDVLGGTETPSEDADATNTGGTDVENTTVGTGDESAGGTEDADGNSNANNEQDIMLTAEEGEEEEEEESDTSTTYNGAGGTLTSDVLTGPSTDNSADTLNSIFGENGATYKDGVLTLNGNVTLSGQLKISTDVTIDLGSHTLTSSYAGYSIVIGTSKDTTALNVAIEGSDTHATIKNSSNRGIQSYGNLTITNVDVEAADWVLVFANNNTKSSVTNSNITATGKNYAGTNNNGVTYKEYAGRAIENSGELTLDNVSITAVPSSSDQGTIEASNNNTVTWCGYFAVINTTTGTLTVKNSKMKAYSQCVENAFKATATLEDVTAEVTCSKIIKSSDGKTYIVAGNEVVKNYGGYVTINGGTYTTASIVESWNVITSMGVDGSQKNEDAYVKITDATITNNQGGGVATLNGSTVTIAGNTTITAKIMALGGNNTMEPENYIITGGTLKCTDDVGIFVPAAGTLSIEGTAATPVVIEGKTGIFALGGNISIGDYVTITGTISKTISNSNITSSSDNCYLDETLLKTYLGGEGSGSRYDGSAILLVSGRYTTAVEGGGDASLTITGGTFNGASAVSADAIKVLETDKKVGNTGSYVMKFSSISITGGTFSSNPTAIKKVTYSTSSSSDLTNGTITDAVPATYAVTVNNDNTYTVEEATGLATESTTDKESGAVTVTVTGVVPSTEQTNTDDELDTSTPTQATIDATTKNEDDSAGSADATVVIPADTAATMGEAAEGTGGYELTVKADHGTVTLDSAAMAAVIEAAKAEGGDTVTRDVKISVKKDDTAGSSSVTAAYTIDVVTVVKNADGTETTDTPLAAGNDANAKITISLPIPAGKDENGETKPWYYYYVSKKTDSDSNKTTYNPLTLVAASDGSAGTIDDTTGLVTFKTSHLSTYASFDAEQTEAEIASAGFDAKSIDAITNLTKAYQAAFNVEKNITDCDANTIWIVFKGKGDYKIKVKSPSGTYLSLDKNDEGNELDYASFAGCNKGAALYATFDEFWASDPKTTTGGYIGTAAQAGDYTFELYTGDNEFLDSKTVTLTEDDVVSNSAEIGTVGFNADATQSNTAINTARTAIGAASNVNDSDPNTMYVVLSRKVQDGEKYSIKLETPDGRTIDAGTLENTEDKTGLSTLYWTFDSVHTNGSACSGYIGETLMVGTYTLNLYKAINGEDVLLDTETVDIKSTDVANAEIGIYEVGFNADPNESNAAINAARKAAGISTTDDVKDSDPNTMYVVLNRKLKDGDSESYTVTLTTPSGKTVTFNAMTSGSTLYWTFDETNPNGDPSGGYINKGVDNEADKVKLEAGEYTISLYKGNSATGTAVATKTISLGSVKYELGGGTGDVPAQTYYTTGTEITLASAPSKANYTFDGWYVDGSKAGDAGDTYEVGATDVTLIAKWAEISVTGVTLNKNTLALTVGGTETLTATVTPSNATNKAVTWSSSDTSVAKVENGVVTAVSAGTATITATAGEKSAVCDVTVTKPGTSSSGSSGGSSSSNGYTVSVSSASHGKVTASPTSATKGTKVTLTVKPDDGYELADLVVTDKNGDEVDLTKVSDTRYTFTMPGCRVEVDATFVEIDGDEDGEGTGESTYFPTHNATSFTDISSSAYYYNAVLWAVENGITTGTSATTFSPDMSCTRAQMVTFLWRAAGSPSVSGVNPFTDVQPGTYYYDAVLWAVSKGITTGTSATTFSPDDTVSRAQTVTFLWRYAGSPAAGGSSFADVTSGAYYASAVQWAVNNAVTTGTSATTFSPDNDCTRAQIVTFLYRDLAK